MYAKTIFLKISLLFLLFITISANAQISYGGRPLPFTTLRSYSQDFFKTMPSFDVEAEKRMDSLSRTDLKSGVRFAYKFMTDFTPANSGTSFILADGTKVWRLGIRSEKAYSLNVLFTEYELPEGARLFLYSPDQSQVLGSFNHLNNSELELLPVAPVNGDELIIEYQEPAGAAFAGRLKVGEVNHGYRDFRGIEPTGDLSGFYCMPSPVCFSDTTEKYEEVVRSVVLLIIDGTTLCTGGLLNNIRNDGTPYLLTASHCLNNQFRIPNPDYAQIAGTIVSFFNYESPFCSSVIRGTQELSMASSILRAVNEKTDMALLELLEIPPAYYRPYYAGWNVQGANQPPYTNIHQPGGSVKRIGISSGQVSLVSYSDKASSPVDFNPESFWFVDRWDTGCTAAGSSGSPLFDSNYRVIGALTGGQSTCSTPRNDLFYALHKSWTAGSTDQENLLPWLSPGGNSVLLCDGLDPYEEEAVVKLSNIQPDGSRELAEVAYLPASVGGHQFGVNPLGINEYAEAFEIGCDALLHGVYLVTPPAQNTTALSVEVNVYTSSANASPAEIIRTAQFSPTYTNTSIIDGSFIETPKSLSRSQESFIKFDTPVAVSENFFVGYKIMASERDSFTVYSLPGNAVAKNTAWLNYRGTWIENTSHPSNPYRSSLFVSPVVQYSGTGVPNIDIPAYGLRVTADRKTKTVTVVAPAGSGGMRYEVFSIDGKSVHNGYMDKDLYSFTLRQKGVYIVRIFSEQGKYVAKIIL